jgi:hypothetical protein
LFFVDFSFRHTLHFPSDFIRLHNNIIVILDSIPTQHQHIYHILLYRLCSASPTMSLRFPSSLLMKNSPALVATAGVSILLGLPALEAAAASSAVSLAVLKGANCLAFLVNAASVSVPGRLDGQKSVNPAKTQDNINHNNNNSTSTSTSPASTIAEGTPLVVGAGKTETEPDTPPVYGARSLVSPSGWAFAIWAPIYVGEAVFCTAQLFATESSALAQVLPEITGSFVAANLIQSLWCASFRSSYHTDSHGWQKYVSVAMLAGTAYSLSHVHNVAMVCSPEALSLGWYFLPLTMHFGWTTAATLVNLNGALAQDQPDSTLIAAGHASAITATTLGVGITLAQASPVYGFTIAWALAACANEAAKKASGGGSDSDSDRVETVSAYQKGAAVQKMLCWAGSAVCVATSLFQIMS